METTRKAKGTLHWISIPHAIEAEIRLYDRLFTVPEPEDVEEGQDFKDFINPDSLEIVIGWCEPSIKSAVSGKAYQFERLGYFNTDKDSSKEKLVFNRTVTLRDSWAKIEKNRDK
jgi:glutaminyl-tRNA synthetase